MTDKKDEALKLALGYMDGTLMTEHLTGYERKRHVMQSIREALAEQPAQQQQEPHCYMDEYGNVHGGYEDWMENEGGWFPVYTSPPASKPWVGLTDEQILSLVPGLQDCLCDPWDYNNSGDYYASIPKDMIRLAQAIEAKLKEKNT